MVTAAAGAAAAAAAAAVPAVRLDKAPALASARVAAAGAGAGVAVHAAIADNGPNGYIPLLASTAVVAAAAFVESVAARVRMGGLDNSGGRDVGAVVTLKGTGSLGALLTATEAAAGPETRCATQRDELKLVPRLMNSQRLRTEVHKCTRAPPRARRIGSAHSKEGSSPTAREK
ncbi:hypothetical protein VOLCADRAFT_100007 [Volvox carteri f. nagariensis]|uniref:Uncharacterized protein n=1 Tax=Volvox carteri f. nagariensis TaxID=3068 RepID=D8UJ63_VOLCA|nr:uncharacterized protein VOLCADRAFT_100007 [Volvox carteri f. nagariensis]EFJ40232.1 hypothetical protein VOLCADRAFT_100007 [Volvox carteri f. nagariensis]|eukprot:XP_002958712.1 hypothetical protein VOLCADRAFT_100007 [Volvox carteri f. nagariensis]